MNDLILESWLEMFIMVMEGKKSFKFGQLTMNIEVFEANDTDSDRLIWNFVDVSNVRFGLLAKIETKKDFDTFMETFEAGIEDFILLSDYEELQDVIFTGEAKVLITKEIGEGKMWINNEWSDQINLNQYC